MSWTLPLLLLVALQPHQGSASVTGEQIQVHEDVEAYEEAPGGNIITLPTTTPELTTSPGTDPCTPSCDGADSEHPMVADPLDCHKYYICFYGELDGPMDCPDGEYFNTTKMDCVPNGAEECTAVCEPGTGGACSYTCDNPNTKFVADRFDCSAYYECSDLDAVKTCSGETPFFDGNGCQADESVCCHCKPYCYAQDEGKRVMDPLNCTKYYFCFEGNEIPEYDGACPFGENFDIFKQKCSSTAPCLTLCTSVLQDECSDMFTCEEVGHFAAYPKGCDPRYYHCTEADIGNILAATTCPGAKVFHPHERRCVAESDCPYTTSRH